MPRCCSRPIMRSRSARSARVSAAPKSGSSTKLARMLRAGRDRRDRHSRSERDERLLGAARGDRRDDPRRLAAFRRSGARRRQRLRLRRRPQEGHGDQRRRQHLSARDRGRHLGASGRRARSPSTACPTRTGARRWRRPSFCARAHCARPEDIVDFCRRRIGGYKVPKRIRILAELPKNASGKILKTELRKTSVQA